MATRPIASAAVAGLLLVLVAAVRESAPPASAAHEPAGAPQERRWLIPLPHQQLRMHATVLLPAGPGPFPLAVINHGSSENSARRAGYPMPTYPLASQWLLDRGFAVALPLRPGHGETGGPYFEDQGRCQSADYLKAGLATADAIAATIDYLGNEPFMRKSGVVVLGQSAGGWGALALASRNPATVRAVIDFAGGRGGHADDLPNNNCVPDRLVETAGVLGRSARTPTLWLYANNDTYFAPSLSQRMYAAFKSAGGRGEYHLLPAFGPEGHFLIGSDDAFALWQPILESFLAAHP